jgi:Putative lumazine-binding
VKTLETVLDPGFRIVMNRMFGSTQVDIMDRQLYLSKISSGEFGGEMRASTIEQVNVNGNTATALVKLAGAKMTFTSTLVLVQDADGRWRIVSDVPVIG